MYSVYVCMYVCVYVCMYVYIEAYYVHNTTICSVHLCMHIHKRIMYVITLSEKFACVCMCVSMYVYTTTELLMSNLTIWFEPSPVNLLPYIDT